MMNNMFWQLMPEIHQSNVRRGLGDSVNGCKRSDERRLISSLRPAKAFLLT